jgi:hypothetical protein
MGVLLICIDLRSSVATLEFSYAAAILTDAEFCPERVDTHLDLG